jgi:hypothetical protein
MLLSSRNKRETLLWLSYVQLCVLLLMRFGARFKKMGQSRMEARSNWAHATQLSSLFIGPSSGPWATLAVYNHLLEPKLILYLFSVLGLPLHRFKLNMLANTRPQAIAKIEGLDQKLNKNNTAILADTLHFESEAAGPVRNTQSYQA